MMQLYLLNRIRAAVRSLVDCTSPEIHYNGVFVQGYGLASPYVSHKRVNYGYSGVEDDALVARSSRYGLLISDRPLNILKERYKDMGYVWRECVPNEYPFVARWQGGQIPRVVLEPLFALAQKLGLGTPFDDEPFLHAYAVTPQLAGWHYRRPVHEFAKGDAGNPALNMLKVEGEPVHQQGSLLVLKERIPQGFPELFSYNWFYNHTKIIDPVELWEVSQEERSARCVLAVGVSYRGQTMAAVGVRAPCRLLAVDHDLVDLNEGEYILLHPFPSGRVD